MHIYKSDIVVCVDEVMRCAGGRLDDLTADAELQEKSAADIKYIVDLLLSQCQQAVKEHEDKNKDLTSSTATTAAPQTQTQVTAERMSYWTSCVAVYCFIVIQNC